MPPTSGRCVSSASTASSSAAPGSTARWCSDVHLFFEGARNQDVSKAVPGTKNPGAWLAQRAWHRSAPLARGCSSSRYDSNSVNSAFCADLGLVPDRRPLAVQHVGGDLLARVRREAVHDERILRREREQRSVDAIRLEILEAARALRAPAPC